MDERGRRLLVDLVGHAEAASGYAREHGPDWWKHRETLDAVSMRISQVGEAASRTSPATLSRIPPSPGVM